MHDAEMSGTVLDSVGHHNTLPQECREHPQPLHTHIHPQVPRNERLASHPHGSGWVGCFAHKKWVTRLLHGIIWPSPRFNPAMAGVVSMYQIVTIAFEYRDLHSAQCSSAALRGKEAAQYAMPQIALLLADIHTGRILYTELIKQAGVRPRTFAFSDKAFVASSIRHQVASTT